MMFVAMVNLAVLGCARHWPTVQGVADRGFVEHRRPVSSLDILPLDVDFAVATQKRGPVDAILRRFHASSMSTIEGELARRGYRVRAALQWDGSYVERDGSRASAIDSPAVIATAESLRGYGYAQSQRGGELLFPYLPHRLGEHTGADTTLYVGGWAYVGKQRTSTGAKVAKGVLIGAIVVVVVIAVVASLKKGGGPSARGAGKVASSAGKGTRVVVRGAGTTARVFGRAARVGGKTLASTGGSVLRTTAKLTARTAIEVLDAFGRSNTHIHIYGGDPAEYERDLPRQGYSRMEIEMTLIDNADGRVLWHARQQFDADASKARDTAEVMRRMLASLPAQG